LIPVVDKRSRGLRALASAVVPDAGKQAIDRVSARRLLRRIEPLNREFIRRYGLEVRRGPFAGMQMLYLPEQEPAPGNLIAKLVGSYEHQVYRWLQQEWIDGDWDVVVDVGCAEGFYAVGLALAMPWAQVHAFDTYAPARSQCEELARLNGVKGRVLVAEHCDPSTLEQLGRARVALLSDCEGYEKTLLDPALAPSLCSCSIVVELHDNVDPTISSTIHRRFRDTHDIEMIEYAPMAREALPELSWMSESEARLIVEERPQQMSWALLRPRQPPESR